MKKIRRGLTDFDHEGLGPGEYNPDAILSDIPDVSAEVFCDECGALMVRTGDGWTCPACHPDFEQSGGIE
jgi:hypothetical protein